MRPPRPVSLALLAGAVGGAEALKQIPAEVLRRYKAQHQDVYGVQPPVAGNSQFSGQRFPADVEPARSTHFWPHASGHVRHYTTSNYAGPKDWDNALMWKWHHPKGRYHTTMVGGPVIDEDKSIYVSTEDGIRKFSRDGKVQWEYNTTSAMVGGSSLLGRNVYGSTTDGHIFALSIDTGKPVWNMKYSEEIGSDPSFVEAHGGTVVTAIDGSHDGGNRRIVGLDAESGFVIWQWPLDVKAIDFMAVFPDDDSTVFQDSNGGVFRLSMLTGTVMWNVRPKSAGRSFARGGVALAEDGSVFSCANYGMNNGFEGDGDGGVLRKIALEDGKVEWEKRLPYPCNSWPAISSENNMVVVALGSLPDAPATYNYIDAGKKFRQQLHKDALLAGSLERSMLGVPDLHGALVAFDTKTGSLKWRHEVKPYGSLGAAGDEEGLLERYEKKKGKPFCMPSHWSQPTIDADGVIYVGRLDGNIYSYDPVKEVEHLYSTGSASLPHSIAFAPGMMAYADCDSLYVFNAAEDAKGGKATSLARG